MGNVVVSKAHFLDESPGFGLRILSADFPAVNQVGHPQFRRKQDCSTSLKKRTFVRADFAGSSAFFGECFVKPEAIVRRTQTADPIAMTFDHVL